MNCGHGDAKTFPEGKKGLHPEMAGYDPGMDTSRPGKHGEVLCTPVRQKGLQPEMAEHGPAGQGTPAIQDKTGTQSPACDGEEEPVEGREQEMSLAEQTELPVPVEMSTESSSPTLPELDNDDLEDEVQIENTEEGDVQGYLAENEHLSPFVRLDGNNEASEDYTFMVKCVKVAAGQGWITERGYQAKASGALKLKPLRKSLLSSQPLIFE
ncbi:hypothetical protein AALO_G00170310 [Alosa alosa]|uniref:Uncharacterized protein n=1 Tax=Alosa alosa TaxID=278164 RepID=A0AAV6GGB8_9TELE|nr:hypothetical protein AALO_G00170310 [Alosa alosa]